MIQTRIYLDESSTLFKTFKKRGFIEEFGYKGSFFIWLDDKPSIGELVYVDSSCVSKHKTDFGTYLQNKRKRVILRIDDLCQTVMLLHDDSIIRGLQLKCHEENDLNWI